MALRESGVQLVARGYANYLLQMQNISKAHKEAFSEVHARTVTATQQKIRDEVQKTTGFVGNLKQAFVQLGSGNVTGAVNSLYMAIGGLKGMLAGLIAIPIVGTLYKFAKTSSEIAKRNETLRVSLEDVAKTAGYTVQQIDYATAKLREQGITTQAAQQSLMQMAQAQMTWTHASQLARIAQSAAVIANENSSASFQRIITAIQRGETELLKTIGINVSFEQSYMQLARSMGKSTRELTQQEKVMARTNAVLEAGARIFGVYEAAMQTAGKQQNSLARYIEETQNAVGQLFIATEHIRIQMETAFWKTMGNTAKGLRTWAAAIDALIRLLEIFSGSVDDTGHRSAKLGERIGKALHDSGRTAAQALIMWTAFFSGVKDMLAALEAEITRVLGGQFGKAIKFAWLSATGQHAKAAQVLIEMSKEGFEKGFKSLERPAGESGKNLGRVWAEGFMESLGQQYEEFQKMYPDLFKEYEEIGKAAEVGLEPATEAVNEQVAALQELQEQLQREAAVLRQVEGAYDNYTKGVARASEQYYKNLQDLESDYEKSRANAAQKLGKSLADLEKEASKQRDEIIRDANRRQVEDERQLYRQLEQERKRFELERLQSTRRFAQQEKWLMAEGDVLGLMQARENFQLQQQEAKENFQEQQKDARENFQEQQRIQQEELKRRLDELDASIRERRNELYTSYEEELEQLRQANEERKAELAASYQDQLRQLKEARDEQLAELGKAMRDDEKVTQEGMQKIAERLAEVFGDQGAGDALIRGWAERSSSAIGNALDAIQDRIEQLNAYIARAAEAGEAATQSVASRAPSSMVGIGAMISQRAHAHGMRTGGVGVVTGPRLFEVEPGVKEMVAFAPVRSSTVNVNVGGGIDVRGAEGASPGVVDNAVEMIFDEMRTAIRRLAKR